MLIVSQFLIMVALINSLNNSRFFEDVLIEMMTTKLCSQQHGSILIC